MFRTLLGLVLFGVILGIIVVNYPRIEHASQVHMLRQSARTALASRNWEKAIRLYEEGWRNAPQNRDIATRLAWYYRQANQNDRAEAVYRKVLKQQPDHLDARLGLAGLLQEDPKRVNEAVDQLRMAVSQHPESPMVLTQVGDLYVNAAENENEKRGSVRQWLYSQSIYYYEQSLKRNPKQFLTQFRLGVAQQSLKNLQAAAKAYCAALALNPTSYESRYNLGMTLTALRFRNEGYRQMDRAVAMLADENDMKVAMWLAQRVQNIKNAVYESNDKDQALPGLNEPTPDFIPATCLAIAVKKT
jgi:tetratricopeptide (TPR) repeat protein